MKKTLSVMIGLVVSTAAYSQVGINTPDPKATLDVAAKTTDGTAPEGFIAPRLTADALFTASQGTTPQYGADQDGAIVLVTQPLIDPSNQVGQVVNIDAPGYYYFDANMNQWRKVGEGSIYTGDGTLTGPRKMEMDNTTLGFVNGRVGMGVATSHPSSILELQSTTRGFLPPRMTRAQVDAIVNPAPGLVVYCTDFLGAGRGCLMVNDSVDPAVPEWGSMCSSNASAPNVLAIDCASATTVGSVFSGQPVSGVQTTVPYTGGNGGIYPAATFNSTGVTGLVASLPSGMLNNGNGSFVFNITGTASAPGTASFSITVAGQTCTFTIPVTAASAVVGSLDCGAATFSPTALAQGTPYTGSLTVPYIAGNGQPYPQSSFMVNGLTFTLNAGTLNNGNGNLIYNVTGTPATPGAMTVPISFGGTSCNVTTNVTSGLTVVLPGNNQAWMRHNLGADTSLDPDVPVQGIHGNYYQWGRAAVVATASTPAGAIGGWNTTNAPNNSWQDGTKTPSDPCPAGFRVPTALQFYNLINSNTASNLGTFTESATDYGSAKVIGSGANKLTLPVAGFRSNLNGALSSRGGSGYYWSSRHSTSTATYTYSFALWFTSDYLNAYANRFRTDAASIRCISQ